MLHSLHAIKSVLVNYFLVKRKMVLMVISLL